VDHVELKEDFDPLEVVTRIPSEDPETYQMISRGDTVGVFQIESRAQMAMLPRLRPKEFYDLVIEVAIVRPGPIQGGMVHPFLRRRNGEEPATCPHPDLWPILNRTLGVPLFQEQVMQIAIEGAGYSGGEADQLRRDMAAWKKHGRLLEHRERLLRGFRQKGISREFGEALFEQIKGFGEYGFPESHASSFALLVYASSWQKRHYPAHFTCALINSQPMGFYRPTSLIRDAQAHGVEVRDVCIESSAWDCTLEPVDDSQSRIESQAQGAQKALRLGMRIIKGLGEEAGRRIEASRREQKFSSLSDLRKRAQLRNDELDALAEAGALEILESGRRNALWKARQPQTPGLFADVDADEPEVLLPPLKKAEQLVLDYGRKGLSVTDHPLAHHRKRLCKLGAVRAADLFYLPRGARVLLAGLVMARQRPATAGGVVFITLEDETGSANLIVYSQVFERYHHVARHSQMLFVSGEIERDARLPIAKKPSTSRNRPGFVSLHPDHGANQDTTQASQGSSAQLNLPPVPVIHVIVQHIEAWGNDTARVLSLSRNFH
jgi:error-prone DNA polymerase